MPSFGIRKALGIKKDDAAQGQNTGNNGYQTYNQFAGYSQQPPVHSQPPQQFNNYQPTPQFSNYQSPGTFQPYGSVSPSAPAPTPVVPAEITRELPANFYDDDYRPGGEERVQFDQPLLQEVNTVFLMDDSGSMAGHYWRLVRKCLAVLVDAILQNDSDGIDWYWINLVTTEPGDAEHGIARSGINGIQNPDYVLKMFDDNKPYYGTMIGARLRLILDTYMRAYRASLEPGFTGEAPKPLNLIVMTDGLADDEAVFIQAIVDTAVELDRLGAPERQIGIQLFQIGTASSVKDYFERLDDQIHLYNNGVKIRDMVDTVNFEKINRLKGFSAANLLKVFGGPMLKSQDNIKH